MPDKPKPKKKKLLKSPNEIITPIAKKKALKSIKKLTKNLPKRKHRDQKRRKIRNHQ